MTVAEWIALIGTRVIVSGAELEVGDRSLTFTIPARDAMDSLRRPVVAVVLVVGSDAPRPAVRPAELDTASWAPGELSEAYGR